MKPIEIDELKQLQEEYRKNDKARVVRNALTTTSITSISNVLEAQEANPFFFSVEVPTMKVTNQLQSGRCWIFSSMNVLREIIAKKYKIDQFELSQNYVAFYDKLEKCNWFMNCVLEQIDQPYDDRTLQWLLDNGVGDGGQWDMVVSLVKKYGICPKTAMPETYQSSHTHDMNGLLNKRLRKFASEAKALKPEKREELRTKVLAECYTLIADCFGLPPKSFTFEYVDSKKKYHSVSDVTPKEFYEKYLGEDLDRYAVIINAPTEDKPYHKMYSVKYIGNVVSGNEIRYLNLPMNEFKKAVIAQLKDGKPVWFGCDCVKDGNRQSGLWDDQQFDYEHTFDMDLSMTKEEMLNTRYSAMNHAMVLTGVNLVKGKPTRWKIENSWGDKTANKGYYIASDSWFDKYMYVVAINKKYLSEKAKAALAAEPQEDSNRRGYSYYPRIAMPH